jgi:hypothetical protein
MADRPQQLEDRHVKVAGTGTRNGDADQPGLPEARRGGHEHLQSGDRRHDTHLNCARIWQ